MIFVLSVSKVRQNEAKAKQVHPRNHTLLSENYLIKEIPMSIRSYQEFNNDQVIDSPVTL